MQQVKRKGERDLTGAPRKVAPCIECGEVADIAAHGQCYRCYRRFQREREGQRLAKAVDRHGGAIRREHTKILSGFSAVMKGLAAIGVSEEDTMKVRVLIDPYLRSIKKLLGGPPPPLGTEPILPDSLRDDDEDSHEKVEASTPAAPSDTETKVEDHP